MDRGQSGVTGGRHEAAALEQRKRLVYSIGAAAGILVAALSWFARNEGDVMVEVGYPILAVALLVFIVASHRRWLRLDALETVVYTVLALFIMGRLAWHLLFAGPIEEHLLVLAGGHYHAVAALLVAGFVLLGRRMGLRLGIAVIATSVLMVVAGAGSQLLDQGQATRELLYLARVHGFLVLLLVLVAAVANLRDELTRALARSDALHTQATTDPLTGLANRRVATSVLEDAVDARERYGHPVSVVLVDIDRFKTINDRFGHRRGDQVLVAVADVLRDEVRTVDTLARWGGEELLIVAPGIELPGAQAIAARCRAALHHHRPAGLEVTASFGVTTFTDGDDVDTLLHRADRLMYDAKDRGRDEVVAGT